VAKILIDACCAEDVVVAGILHDTVDDTPVSLDEIRHTFGDPVARIVEGTSEPDKSKPREERKAHTIEFLRTASEAVLLPSVLAVLAERLTVGPGLPLVQRLRKAVEEVFG
jgi:(p)ppGpp synthase/HD superfamily hydrolase